ncbi:MAG TPA: hypothetical protein VFF48_04370 [Brevundimonas sp.]|nr:hypothetical protein [Brevundimonas sp.]
MTLSLTLLLLSTFAVAPVTSDDRVVFISDRDGGLQVWLAEPDGSNPRRLTEGPPAHFPRCSPDGLDVVFERGPPGAREIWVQGIADGPARRLALSAAEYSTPEWLPDRSAIIFTHKVGLYDRIALMRADGAGSPKWVTDHPWDDVMASPTPDGRAVVFHSYRHGPNNPEIYRRDLETGHETRITAIDGQDYEAATDGRRVVFSSNRAGETFQLYMTDLEGGDPRQLTTGDTDAWGPRFGGRGTLFVTGPPGRRKPHVIGEDGLPRALWSGAHDDYSAAWCSRQGAR